jgi:hypothetical protein
MTIYIHSKAYSTIKLHNVDRVVSAGVKCIRVHMIFSDLV